MQPQWQSNIERDAISRKVYDWLTKPYCLSSAIKRLSPEFNMKVIAESAHVLADHERCQSIDFKANTVYQRESYLCAGDTPWVYASVLFASSDAPQLLRDLGARPLGETLLYHTDGSTVARSAMEYSCIERDSALYKPAFERSKQDVLYARRSVFSPSWGQVLVTEVFLDAIASYRDAKA